MVHLAYWTATKYILYQKTFQLTSISKAERTGVENSTAVSSTMDSAYSFLKELNRFRIIYIFFVRLKFLIIDGHDFSSIVQRQAARRRHRSHLKSNTVLWKALYIYAQKFLCYYHSKITHDIHTALTNTVKRRWLLSLFMLTSTEENKDNFCTAAEKRKELKRWNTER